MSLAFLLAGCGGVNVGFEPLPVTERDYAERHAYSVPEHIRARQERLLREQREKEKEEQERLEEAKRQAREIHTPRERQDSQH